MQTQGAPNRLHVLATGAPVPHRRTLPRIAPPISFA